MNKIQRLFYVVSTLNDTLSILSIKKRSLLSLLKLMLKIIHRFYDKNYTIGFKIRIKTLKLHFLQVSIKFQDSEFKHTNFIILSII